MDIRDRNTYPQTLLRTREESHSLLLLRFVLFLIFTSPFVFQPVKADGHDAGPLSARDLTRNDLHTDERKALVTRLLNGLTEAEKKSFKDTIRKKLHGNRKASVIVTGNRYSVMASANCITGYVRKAKVKTSAPDVKILSEQGVMCDATGCNGWQVEAERDSDALFDLEINLKCTQEDWLFNR